MPDFINRLKDGSTSETQDQPARTSFAWIGAGQHATCFGFLLCTAFLDDAFNMLQYA